MPTDSEEAAAAAAAYLLSQRSGGPSAALVKMGASGSMLVRGVSGALDYMPL
jgi:hypothetical protein